MREREGEQTWNCNEERNEGERERFERIINQTEQKRESFLEKCRIGRKGEKLSLSE